MFKYEDHFCYRYTKGEEGFQTSGLSVLAFKSPCPTGRKAYVDEVTCFVLLINKLKFVRLQERLLLASLETIYS
jgi:hypothetical protein